MPTSKELVSNRPLTGAELRALLIKDFAAALDRDGMFQDRMAYARIGYKISIDLHLDNPHYDSHRLELNSGIPARNQRDVVRRNVVPAPITDATDNALVWGLEAARTIDSPNQIRVDQGMALTATRRDTKTGQMIEEAIHVDNQGAEPTEPTFTEHTQQLKRDWKIV